MSPTTKIALALGVVIFGFGFYVGYSVGNKQSPEVKALQEQLEGAGRDIDNLRAANTMLLERMAERQRVADSLQALVGDALVLAQQEAQRADSLQNAMEQAQDCPTALRLAREALEARNREVVTVRGALAQQIEVSAGLRGDVGDLTGQLRDTNTELERVRKELRDATEGVGEVDDPDKWLGVIPKPSPTVAFLTGVVVTLTGVVVASN